MLIGSDDLSLFAGYNNPDDDNAMGLSIENTSLAFALIRQENSDDNRSWISLKANTQKVSFIGIPGISTLSDSLGDFGVQLNLGFGDDAKSVAHFADNPLLVPTGGAFTSLDFDGTDGELIKMEGHVSFNIMDYVFMDGTFGFESSTETVHLKDGSQVETNLFAVSAVDINIFAGTNGPADNNDAVGLTLNHANVALALMNQIGRAHV